jgi:membrane protein implicated in regulation of membrane protease activity
MTAIGGSRRSAAKLAAGCFEKKAVVPLCYEQGDQESRRFQNSGIANEINITMKRYSFTWWLVILPTSVTVGGTTILLTSNFTDWGVMALVAVAVVSTFLADLAIAASMEAIAPTKVSIGPGEKYLDSDLVSEKATIMSGFDSISHGQVSVRGETWRAIRAPDDTGTLTTGMSVNVIDRDGLTLVVSTRSG